MDAGGDQIAIDVEAMASKLKRRLSGKRVLPSYCSIFRIPAILFRHTKTAYVPNAFAIGPLICDKPHLKPTEIRGSKKSTFMTLFCVFRIQIFQLDQILLPLT